MATLKAKTHCYTAWVNMRLTPLNQSMSNVLMDLLQGTNMKVLMEAFTGHKFERIHSFDRFVP
jgi:hypothetical protein